MLPANRRKSQSIGVISGDDPVSRFYLVNREVVNTSEGTHDVRVPGKLPVFVDVFAARQRGHGRDGQVVAGATKNLHPISPKTGVCGSGQTARTEPPLHRESNRAIPPCCDGRRIAPSQGGVPVGKRSDGRMHGVPVSSTGIRRALAIVQSALPCNYKIRQQ